MAFKTFLPVTVIALAAIMAADARDEPRVTTVEVVTTQAATGDGGNGWGGHQCRIVRTPDGVFTAYTVPGKNDFSREWRLAWRRETGWKVVAGGIAGREPVNLLASPDGTLHVIGWPGGKAMHWSGKPALSAVAMQESPVPGLAEGNWPYNSAGIDERGRICVLSSEGDKPGAFRWAMRDPKSDRWICGLVETDYRHCYTYVFPDSRGGLSLISNRDVKWETLGYARPPEVSEYVFNSFGYWHSSDPLTRPLAKVADFEEKPTRRDPVVSCNAQLDAYMDEKGRIHTLHRRQGKSTGGEEQTRYVVFSPDGELLSDAKVPWSAGPMCRIFQDDRGQFYLIGSDGVIYSGGIGAVSFKNKTRLKFGGHSVVESGFGISAPRAGTPPGDVIDVVFPSNWGEKWIYCRIKLHGGAE